MAYAGRLFLLVLLYAAFGLVIGYFSFWPRYRYADSAMAQIKISFSHAADRVEPCVRLTPQQMAELAPNMRRAEVCERARLPLTLEVELDGRVALARTEEPSGLWDDGPASVYARLDVAPGRHRLTARLRDSARGDGWDYTHSEDIALEAGRYYTLTFTAESGGFEFR